MSAPAEQRSGRPDLLGVPARGVAWPVTSDDGPRRPRADVIAGLITVLAGLAGVLQLLLSWSSVVRGVGLPAPNGRVTGWETYLDTRSSAGLSLSNTITSFAVLGAALAGGGLVLLGIAMLTPIDHRPLGVVALLLSAVGVAGLVWWLTEGHQNQSITVLFSNAGPGWYLFIVTGLLGLIGSFKALTTG